MPVTNVWMAYMFDQIRNTTLVLLSLAAICTVFVVSAGADIYQWEYANPANPSLGKQQSTTICADGIGVDAEPWAYLSDLHLDMAYLIGANLHDAIFSRAALSGADLSNANLQEALFSRTNLTGANFAGADVRGATFDRVVPYGFTAEQLYSTASYQTGDIRDIDLEDNDISGWNLADKNLSGGIMDYATLTNVSFRRADLRYVSFYSASFSGADMTDAMVQGARFQETTGFTLAHLYSTASYQAHDLSETSLLSLDLTGGNFTGQNLTEASFYHSTLTSANFAAAVIRGAQIEAATSYGFTAAQFYSTASYQTGDLRGIYIGTNDLDGWNFAGKDLSGADFNNAELDNADFTNAIIKGAHFTRSYQGQITAAQIYSTATYKTGDLTGIDFSGHDLSGWTFAGMNLTNVGFGSTKLIGADLSNGNLSNAYLSSANLTNANVGGADIRGADLSYSGITQAQLYSTASYEAKDLSGGMKFSNSYFSGWNFADQNLTGAIFGSATLEGTNFSRANLTDASFGNSNLAGAIFSEANLTRTKLRGFQLTGAVFTSAIVQGADFGNTTSKGFTAAQFYSTASYQSGDLTGVVLYGNNLTGWNFAGKNLRLADLGSANLSGAILTGANLTDAYLGYATLTNANLSGAIIRGAYLQGVTGFTPAQLYSTASYQAHDLSGTHWFFDNLAGWSFSGQNLQNAFFFGATITGTDFSGADTRGVQQLDPAVPINTNLIRPDGSIHGLQLTGATTLVVRDYDGDPSNFGAAIPIRVENSFAMDASGTLRTQFGSDGWGSLIMFAPGIAVTLGGTLQLDFTADVNVANQFGRTFRVFDWSGVLPVGQFTISSPYAWNLARLYTMGEITFGAVDALAGDFNHDGKVDAGDYLAWRKRGGSGQDFDTWRKNFGTTTGGGSGSGFPVSSAVQPEVPEPGALALVGVIALCSGGVLPISGARRTSANSR